MTDGDGELVRKAPPWTRLACVPVLLLTLAAPWMLFVVLPSPSISWTAGQQRALVLEATGCAGLAILVALVTWQRASAFVRVVLAACVLANVWTLFAAAG